MTVAIAPHKAFGVWFKDLDRWDPISFRKISWKWPKNIMRPIGSFLRPRKEKVDRVKHPFSDLQPITIHFDGSVDKREVDPNREYTMDLFFARPGDIVVAKIDLKNGAVAIAPDWKNVVVTGHFAVYEPDRSKVLPEYFHRVIQTGFFKEHLWRNKVGAEGRKEVKLEFFEGQEIPLPSLQTQRAIVEYWQKAQKAVADIGIRYRRLIEEIDREILKKIGLNLKPPTERKGAFAILWGHLERWDTFFYRLDFTDLEDQLSKLRCMRLGDLLNFVSRPWEPHDFPEGIFRYIEISSVTKENGIIGCRNVRIDNAPSRATTLLQTGDIILATTRPYLGAFAIVTPEFSGSVCSSGFAVADRLKTDNADKDYVLLFLKSSAGLRQLERRMTGGLYPAIVQRELEQTLVPVPPLELQRGIVDMVANHRERITKERKAAEENKAQVTRELEEMILGIRPVPQ
jgi:type I restriction enzyme S subunit